MSITTRTIEDCRQLGYKDQTFIQICTLNKIASLFGIPYDVVDLKVEFWQPL